MCRIRFRFSRIDPRASVTCVCPLSVLLKPQWDDTLGIRLKVTTVTVNVHRVLCLPSSNWIFGTLRGNEHAIHESMGFRKSGEYAFECEKVRGILVESWHPGWVMVESWKFAGSSSRYQIFEIDVERIFIWMWKWIRSLLVLAMAGECLQYLLW